MASFSVNIGWASALRAMDAFVAKYNSEAACAPRDSTEAALARKRCSRWEEARAALATALESETA